MRAHALQRVARKLHTGTVVVTNIVTTLLQAGTHSALAAGALQQQSRNLDRADFKSVSSDRRQGDCKMLGREYRKSIPAKWRPINLRRLILMAYSVRTGRCALRRRLLGCLPVWPPSDPPAEEMRPMALWRSHRRCIPAN